jgi:hypothetical protein
MAGVHATTQAMNEMTTQRFGFSGIDIDDSALIMRGHPLFEENTARV